MTDPHPLIEGFRLAAENAALKQIGDTHQLWIAHGHRDFTAQFFKTISKKHAKETSLSLVNLLLDILNLRRRRGKKALEQYWQLITHLIDRAMTPQALRLTPIPKAPYQYHWIMAHLIYPLTTYQHQFKAALRLSEYAPEHNKPFIQIGIAKSMAKAGQHVAALKILRRLSSESHEKYTLKTSIKITCRLIRAFIDCGAHADAAKHWDVFYAQNHPIKLFELFEPHIVSDGFYEAEDFHRASQATEMVYRVGLTGLDDTYLLFELMWLRSALSKTGFGRKLAVVLRALEAKANHHANLDTRLRIYAAIASDIVNRPSYQRTFERLISKIKTTISLKRARNDSEIDEIWDILAKLAENGQVERAFELVEEIENPWQAFYFAFESVLSALQDLGQHQRAKSLLISEWKRIISLSPQDKSFQGRSKPSLMAQLASITVSLGFLDEAIQMYPSITEESEYTHYFQYSLMDALADAGRWEDIFMILDSADLTKLFEVWASLRESLDKIRRGLAYDVLMTCIKIAARIRPEWARIAAILT